MSLADTRRSTSSALSLIAVVVMMLAPSSVRAGTPFVVETVTDDTTANDVWRSRSLALDAEGTPAIAYLEKRGRQYVANYATRVGGSWAIETFDDTLPKADMSLVIDSDGRAHASYQGYAWFSPGLLRYAYRSETAWTTETVDDAGYMPCGEYSSIGLDDQGRPCICYTHVIEGWYGEGYDNLHFARKDGSTWAIGTVDSRWTDEASAGAKCDMAFAPNGVPYISYAATKFQVYDHLVVAIGPGPVWQKEIVDELGARSTSIAVDAQSNPHVAYRQSASLKYARKSGGAWLIETAIAGWNGLSGFASLELDNTGNPHISIADLATGDLLYVRKLNSAWMIGFADQAPTSIGGHTSLELQSGREPMIVYRDDSSRLLKWARNRLRGMDSPEGSLALSREAALFGDGVMDGPVQIRPNILRGGPATIVYRGTAVQMAIFDLSGRRLRTLQAAAHSAGSSTSTWDGTDDSGDHVAAGTYFLRLTSDSGAEVTQRITIVR
jgi:FlgD Ig-like domain